VQRDLQLLVTLASEVQLPLTLEELLQRVVQRAATMTDTKRASIRLLDAARQRLFIGCRAGDPLHEDGFVEFKPGEGLLGWVAQSGKPLRCGNAEADPRFVKRGPTKEPMGSFLGVPLNYQGTCIGVISAVHPDPDHFTEEHEALLRVLAGLCAPHLEVARLARLARLDPLSHTLNPRGIQDAFPDFVAGDDEDVVSQLSVLVVDVDSLGLINDAWGRAAGDEVLRVVSRVLSSELRAGDSVIRTGEDEFVLVAAGVGLTSASRIAERARAAIMNQAIPVGPNRVQATVSIGVAQRRRGESREALTDRARAALKSARERGTNTVRLATE
jgi:diguanylate cyclase (GGDEF)-like protein